MVNFILLYFTTIAHIQKKKKENEGEYIGRRFIDPNYESIPTVQQEVWR